MFVLLLADHRSQSQMTAGQQVMIQVILHSMVRSGLNLQQRVQLTTEDPRHPLQILGEACLGASHTCLRLVLVGIQAM